MFVSAFDSAGRGLYLIVTLGPASHGAFRGFVKHTSHYQSVFCLHIWSLKPHKDPSPDIDSFEYLRAN
jgi:hypothetical protein